MKLIKLPGGEKRNEARFKGLLRGEGIFEIPKGHSFMLDKVPTGLSIFYQEISGSLCVSPGMEITNNTSKCIAISGLYRFPPDERPLDWITDVE
jgi:hypothetical protein